MRAWAVGIVLMFCLAGCGDKASDSIVTPEKDDAGRYVIHLRSDRTFDPDHASVKAGSGVVFKAELEGCWIKSDEPGGPDSKKGSGTNSNTGLVPKGGEYAWLAVAGTFHVACSLHEGKGMTMVLEVS